MIITKCTTLYTEQLLKEQHEKDNFVDTRIAFLQHQVSVSTVIMLLANLACQMTGIQSTYRQEYTTGKGHSICLAATYFQKIILSKP